MSTGRIHRLALGLAGLCVLGSGCAEEPSYRMRWDVLPRSGQMLEPLPDYEEAVEGGVGVQNPNECTRVGVINVEVTAYEEFSGLIADRRIYPCFPREFRNPNGVARGAALPEGNYEIVVRGLRRNGRGWIDPIAFDRPIGAEYDDTDPLPRCSDDGNGCAPGFVSCDCRRIEAVDGSSRLLDGLVLDAPPECEDGIDNDRDGLVDQVDPGCSIGGVSESDDVSSVQFRVTVSLLGNNPNTSCARTDIAELAYAVDGEEVLRSPCRLSPQFFTDQIDAGMHELSVVALGPGGSPVTHPDVRSFEVVGQGGFVDAKVDFGDADFIEPIRAPTTIPLSYESTPGSTPHQCEFLASEPPPEGELDIDAIRVTVLDARGDELDPPILDSQGVPLDGRRRPCPTGNLRTQPLTWGGYLVEIQALALVADPDDPMAPLEEVVCYSTAATRGPEPLAPESTTFSLQRPEGPIPEACRECGLDRRCEVGSCVDGVCIE